MSDTIALSRAGKLEPVLSRARKVAAMPAGGVRALGWAGVIGAVLVGIFVVLALFGNWLEPFGTDELGRDELSQIISGARIAILSAVESVAVALVLGMLLGIIAGYWGGSWLDSVVSRLVDFLFAFPEYVLAIIVIAALGPGLTNASLAIGIVYTPRVSRIVRTAAMEVAHSPYIDAARLSRRGGLHLVMNHLIPNITSPVLIMVALSLSNAEGAYAALSYLGFGVPPPAPDYGSMLGTAQSYLTTDPWLALFPSAALVLLIIGFILLGDALRDRFSRRIVRPVG
jgi:peptide/nickel transport system permease protein